MFLRSRRPSPTGSSPKPVDHRASQRQPMLGVTAMIRSESGVALEGVVQDISDGGIGISGEMAGLLSGDKVEIVLVIQGQKVRYFGQVRHMDPPNRFYGILLEAGPLRGDQKREAVKECRQCRKQYPDEHKFCYRCGQRLIGGHHIITSESAPQ